VVLNATPFLELLEMLQRPNLAALHNLGKKKWGILQRTKK
jgi:hypothetical protein